MKRVEFVSVAVPRPLEQLYTYSVPKEIAESIELKDWQGSWVTVPFGKQKTHAYVLESAPSLDKLVASSQHSNWDVSKIKSISSVGGQRFQIPREILDLCRWAQRYYHAPMGEVLLAAVPPAVLGVHLKKPPKELEAEKFDPEIKQLNRDQQEVVEKIEEAWKELDVALLDGVTGSGKTEVYLELARRKIADGKGVLFLVPEIALTPQLHQRIQAGLGETVALWHSAVSASRRRDQWLALKEGRLRAVVGARSAIFAPLQNLGLIVVDEEHDSSYKQEDRFRYQARDLAVVRSKLSPCKVVLGSATPSLESLENVRLKRYAIGFLKKRVHEQKLPRVRLIDLTEDPPVSALRAPFSQVALSRIEETLQSGEQVLIYLNRRGFAAFYLCRSCKAVMECPECSISLTYYRKRNELRCHLCGHREKKPQICPQCSSSDLEAIGAGTESLEDELPHLVSGMKLSRLDRDHVTSTGRLEKILADFKAGKTNTLVGTQMLVKGHDFPNVTLVVVVLADSLLSWPDFRASERAIQVLLQVSGRAGRSNKSGEVLLQTYNTDHAVFKVLLDESSRDDFIENERQQREALNFPPVGRMVRLRLEGRSKAEVHHQAQWLSQKLLGENKPDVAILGPSEPFIERLKGVYRWDILLKARNPSNLHALTAVAKSLSKEKRWPLLVDVDPNGLG